MKLISNIFVSSLFMIATSLCIAEEFTAENLIGTWTFTHILMDDGSSEIQVNMKVEIEAGGSYKQYLPTGDLFGTATWEISGNTLKYSDDNGEQNWELVSFEAGILRVDNRGAEMFFEKQ